MQYTAPVTTRDARRLRAFRAILLEGSGASDAERDRAREGIALIEARSPSPSGYERIDNAAVDAFVARMREQQEAHDRAWASIVNLATAWGQRYTTVVNNTGKPMAAGELVSVTVTYGDDSFTQRLR